MPLSSPPETLNLALTLDRSSILLISTHGDVLAFDNVGESGINANNIVRFERVTVAA